MFATVYARKVVTVKVSTQLLHFITSPDKTYQEVLEVLQKIGVPKIVENDSV